MTVVLVITIATFAVIVPLVIFALLAARKRVCPGCRARALQLTEFYRGTLEDGARVPHTLSSFRCRACGSEWRNYNGKGLITLEAYQAGAREPIPTAIVNQD